MLGSSGLYDNLVDSPKSVFTFGEAEVETGHGRIHYNPAWSGWRVCLALPSPHHVVFKLPVGDQRLMFHGEIFERHEKALISKLGLS